LQLTRVQELSEAKNHAESLIYDTEANIESFKDTLSKEDAESLKADIATLKGKLSGENLDPEAIKSATNDLKQASMKKFEAAYNRVRFC
jgi:molecular chaperone DnaK